MLRSGNEYVRKIVDLFIFLILPEVLFLTLNAERRQLVLRGKVLISPQEKLRLLRLIQLIQICFVQVLNLGRKRIQP